MLLLWGGYTTLAWLGAPGHVTLLLEPKEASAVAAACASPEALLCRGWHALVPTVSRALDVASPLAGYAVASVVLGLVACAFVYQRSSRDEAPKAVAPGPRGKGGERRARRHRKAVAPAATRTGGPPGASVPDAADAARGDGGRIRFALAPWHVLVCFVAALWLLFTSLGLGEGARSVRRVVEPTAQTYPGLPPEALAVVRADFFALKGAGCLEVVGRAPQLGGAQVADLSTSCFQRAFFVRVLPQLGFVLLFLIELLVLGRVLLGALGFRSPSVLSEAAFSLGLGACGWVSVLLALSVVASARHPLYGRGVGWALFVLVPLVGHRHLRYWAGKLVAPVPARLGWPALARSGGLAWFLVSLLALGFLSVVRPFPIGWDDMGVYLNRPRLLVSYGHGIGSMSRPMWEFLTSLGFLLFGYGSHFGTGAAMAINWTASMLAVLAIWAFGRHYLGRGGGLVAALLYSLLPVIGQISFVDMKIDNAVFVMGALGTFAVFLALFPAAGVPTPDAAAPASDAVAPGPDAGAPVPAGGWRRIRSVLPLEWRCYVLAGILVAFAFSFKQTAAIVLVALGTVLVGALAGPVAWIGAALLAAVALISLGAVDLPAVIARIAGHPVPAARTVALACGVVAGLAGIFWGWRRRPAQLGPMLRAGGLFAFAFVVAIAPWAVRNAALHGRPGLHFDAPERLAPKMSPATLSGPLALDPQHPACVASGIAEEMGRYAGYGDGLTHYLGLPWRTLMNLDIAGYYVTQLPLLLAVPLVLLLPFFWSPAGRWLRWLCVGTAFMVVEWVFTSTGIPWYGIGILFGVVLGVEALLRHAPGRSSRIALGVLLGISLVVGVSLRMHEFRRTHGFLDYAFGKISADGAAARAIPHYERIASAVTVRRQTMPGRPYLYRMGTQISYFIPRNLEIIGVEDSQLDFFHCLNQGGVPEVTLSRLRALGFNSIIFDTHLVTVERDPQGSLHKKVEEFLAWVNDPRLQLHDELKDPARGIAFILLP